MAGAAAISLLVLVLPTIFAIDDKAAAAVAPSKTADEWKLDLQEVKEMIRDVNSVLHDVRLLSAFVAEAIVANSADEDYKTTEKRGTPTMGFFGSRGKRRSASYFGSRGKRAVKSYGFYGSRGKKADLSSIVEKQHPFSDESDVFNDAFKRAQFFGARG